MNPCHILSTQVDTPVWKRDSCPRVNHAVPRYPRNTPSGTVARSCTASSCAAASCNSHSRTYPHTEDPASSSYPSSHRHLPVALSRSTRSDWDYAWSNFATPSCSSQSMETLTLCRYRFPKGWRVSGGRIVSPWRWGRRMSRGVCFGSYLTMRRVGVTDSNCCSLAARLWVRMIVIQDWRNWGLLLL